MKKPGAELHELIRAMDGHEKRYFNIFASFYNKSEGNKYVHLFKAIDKQEEYDEKEIKKKFRNDPFLDKQLTRAKISLYNLILKSLRNYAASGSMEREVDNMLIDAKNLLDKKLFVQSEKLLNKIEKRAEKYDMHVAMLNTLSVKESLMHATSYHGLSNDDIIDHQKKIQQCINLHTNVCNYEAMISELFMQLQRQGMTRTQDDIKVANTINSSPLFKDVSCALSLKAQGLHYRLRSFYNMINSDFTSAYNDYICILKIYEENEYLKKEYPAGYKVALDNFVVSLIELKRFSEAEQAVKEIKDITKLLPGKKIAEETLKNYVIEIFIYINTGNYRKGIECIKDGTFYLKKKIEEGNLDKQIEINFYVISTYIFFLAKNYKEANTYINKVLNDPGIESFAVYRAPAKMMQIMIHYELGDSEFLEHLIRSLYRYYYKKDREFKFETLILNFIKKRLPKIHDKKEMLLFFQNLRSEIIELVKDPYEATGLLYFDFISWLDSKIENRSLAEVLQEKTKTQERVSNHPPKPSKRSA